MNLVSLVVTAVATAVLLFDGACGFRDERSEDCVVSYSAWSSCSEPCGRGLRERKATVVRYPRGNGRQCPELREQEYCNQFECNPSRDCQVQFSDWSQCSTSCGLGIRHRYGRVVSEPSGSGRACPELEEVEQCVAESSVFCQPPPGPPLPPVDDCEVQFYEWSPCSRSCGDATRMRQGFLESPTGQECPDQSVEESESCNNPDCPAPIAIRYRKRYKGFSRLLRKVLRGQGSQGSTYGYQRRKNGFYSGNGNARGNSQYTFTGGRFRYGAERTKFREPVLVKLVGGRKLRFHPGPYASSLLRGPRISRPTYIPPPIVRPVDVPTFVERSPLPLAPFYGHKHYRPVGLSNFQHLQSRGYSGSVVSLKDPIFQHSYYPAVHHGQGGYGAGVYDHGHGAGGYGFPHPGGYKFSKLNYPGLPFDRSDPENFEGGSKKSYYKRRKRSLSSSSTVTENNEIPAKFQPQQCQKRIVETPCSRTCGAGQKCVVTTFVPNSNRRCPATSRICQFCQLKECPVLLTQISLSEQNSPSQKPQLMDCTRFPDGDFPVPGAKCTQRFVKCSNGRAVEATCGMLYFNPETRTCDQWAYVIACSGNRRPELAPQKSTTTAAPVTPDPLFDCTDKPDGIYTDPRSKCSNLRFVCSRGITTRETCPENLYFKISENRCEKWIDVFECSGAKPGPKQTERLRDFKPVKPIPHDCGKSGDGSFRNPLMKCSNFYYVCSEGKGYEMRCPFSLYFDDKAGYCSYMKDVMDCNVKRNYIALPAQLPLQNQKIPNRPLPTYPFSCRDLKPGIHSAGSCKSYFWSCSNRITFKIDCPPSLLFDNELSECNRQQEIPECGGERPIVTINKQGPRVLPESIGFDCLKREDGVYSAGQCKNYYYSCGGSIARKMMCPPTTKFDSEMYVCDNDYNLPECGGTRPIIAEDNQIVQTAKDRPAFVGQTQTNFNPPITRPLPTRPFNPKPIRTNPKSLSRTQSTQVGRPTPSQPDQFLDRFRARVRGFPTDNRPIFVNSVRRPDFVVRPDPQTRFVDRSRPNRVIVDQFGGRRAVVVENELVGGRRAAVSVDRFGRPIGDIDGLRRVDRFGRVVQRVDRFGRVDQVVDGRRQQLFFDPKTKTKDSVVKSANKEN